MTNQNILYRPYKSINKSIEVLDDNLVQIVKSISSIYIHSIVNKNYENVLNNDDFLYYFNNGNCHYSDLYKYHNVACKQWKLRGGDIISYISDVEDQIIKLADKCKKYKYPTSMCTYHKQLLIMYDSKYIDIL